MDGNPAATRQQLFDFRERDKLLAAMCLPRAVPLPDGSASSAAMKAVLYRIHFHAKDGDESFPGVPSMAMATGLNEKTVRRAIAALKLLGIISVEFKRSEASRVVCNHYRFLMDEVLRRQPGAYTGHPENVPSATVEQPECRQEGAAIVTGRCQSDRPCATSDRTWEGERAAMVDRPSGHDAHRIQNSGMEERNKKEFQRPEFSVGQGQGEKRQSDSWRLREHPPITLDTLHDPADVETLWRLTLTHERTRGLFHAFNEEHRRLVFALAHRCYRKHARGPGEPERGQLKSGVGFFHCILAQGPAAVRAQRDDETDDQWAREAIRGLTVEATPAYSKAPALDPDAVKQHEFDQEKRRQLAAWREAMKRGEFLTRAAE